MTYSAKTVYFLHQQFANGHRLPDPWSEACALRKAMTRTAHLFDCLWRSEQDPVRFENLQGMGIRRLHRRKDEIDGHRAIRQAPTEEAPEIQRILSTSVEALQPRIARPSYIEDAGGSCLHHRRDR